MSALRRLLPPKPTPARVAALAGVLAVGSLPLLRTWSLQWGTTESELDAELPGDDLLPIADHQSTRAISIRAAADQVWPWLVQLGKGRGGFYSYDFLENLAGLDIRSADRIEPHLQTLAVGDLVALAEGFELEVAMLEPGRTLVLRSPLGSTGTAGPPFRFTWSFTLLPGAVGTRLVVRERYQYLAKTAALVVEPASLVSFLMSQQMLRGIRERAESAAFLAA